MSAAEELAAKLRDRAEHGEHGDRDRYLANGLVYGTAHESRDELIVEARARLGGDGAGGEPEAAGGDPGAVLIDFSQIKSHRVEWLWPERIALRKMTALSGRPKIGKGLLYTDVAAETTRGTLGGDLDGPAHVIIVTTEDDPGDTLKPRLVAAGADLDRISMFQMGSKDDPVPFRVPEHADKLGDKVRERNTALVVIDPLIEFIDGSLDAHKSHAVRQALASLNPIAREMGCAILAIIHLNKGSSTDTHLRHEASAAFTQVVRGGLLLGRDPDDPEGETGDQRVLAVSSSNLARIPPALVYRIDPAIVDGDDGKAIDTAQIVLIGESAADSHDLLRGHDPEESGERAEASQFLEAELADGPRKAKEVERVFTGAQRTLRRARKDLGIKAHKEPTGPAGEWWWAAPDQAFPWEAGLGGQALDGRPYPRGGGHLKETRINTGDSHPSQALDGHAFGGGQVSPAEEGRPVVDEAVTELGQLLPVDEADARIGAIDGSARERNGNRDEHRDLNEMLREDGYEDGEAR
jgi:hypothetical protein